MRIKKHRPWLTPTGVEIPTSQLKEICKTWNPATWDSYLNWYESSRREALVAEGIYRKKCNEQQQTIFEQINQDTSRDKRDLCDHLLKSLPPVEAKVIRLTYFEGRTQREIAALVGLSQPGVFKTKERALGTLRRGQQGDKVITRRFMRGMSSESQASEPSFWDSPLSEPLREEKVYDPNQHQKEFESIKHHALKAALRDLSERQQRIIYLRFWCDYSIPQIARDLRMGVNMVDEICTATLSKLKRKIIQIESGYEPGGGPSCA